MQANAEDSPVDKGPFGEVNDAVVYPPPAALAGAHIDSLAKYKAMHERSIKDPNGFWGEMAKENLTWFRDFKEVCVHHLLRPFFPP